MINTKKTLTFTTADFDSIVLANGVNNTVSYQQAYPEIRRVNGRILTQTVKEFLYKNNLISESELNDPELDKLIIARGIFAAFASGLLSLNATKQTGIIGYTPVRMSTGLDGKMKDVWSFSTLSLCNPFCVKRMQNKDLVCGYCYVPATLHIDGILQYVQNFYVLNSGPLPECWIPEIRVSNSILHPIIRLESFGDLFSKIQAENYFSIANKNPIFRFGLWTKNPAVFAAAADEMGKPSNLSSVYSMSRINQMDKNPGKWTLYFDHMFVVVDSDEIKEKFLIDPDFYTCKCGPRSCIECQACYKKPVRITTAVEKLRK